jgi:hypothetical protein
MGKIQTKKGFNVAQRHWMPFWHIQKLQSQAGGILLSEPPQCQAGDSTGQH